MSTLVTILHVLVCLFLMLTVLLQQGKGGGMGGAFGGSNAGSVFGGAGASTFLRRLTATAATVFMLTSMVLAYIASNDAGDSLEKISEREADKRRRSKEAERRAFETGDAGAAATTPDGDAGVTPLVDPGTSTGSGSGAVLPGTGATGAEVPAEVPPATPPAAGSATTTPTTPPATPPTAPVALPPGAAPVKPPAGVDPVKPPGEPAAGSADKPATPAAAPATP